MDAFLGGHMAKTVRAPKRRQRQQMAAALEFDGMAWYERFDLCALNES